MVQRLLQHCCRPRSSVEASAGYIWIGDEILSAQWTKFARSTGVYTTVPSRSFSKRPSSRRQLCRGKPFASTFDQVHLRNNETTYTSRRHGSAAPGPLEARKRRALQKHMTGAANLGMFGSGLDFSESSWRQDVRRAGKGINASGSTIYEALGMIWRWWLLDPDAPVRHENVVTPGVMENAPSDSFMELLSSLEASWTQRPASIFDLLDSLSSIPRPNQSDLLKKVCSWITAEVSLGSMTEKQINRIVWNVSQLESRESQSNYDLGLAICQSIAQGVLDSAIRPLQQLQKDTVWLLVRSLASFGLYHKVNARFVSEILQTLFEHEPTQALQILLAVLNIGTFTASKATQSNFLGFLRSLPSDLSIPGVLLFAQRLLQIHKTQQTSASLRRLEAFLCDTTVADLLRQLRAQSHFDTQRLQFEHDLSKLNAQIVAAYLQTADETDVCRYVMEHVVENFKQMPNRMGRQSHQEDMASELARPQIKQTYLDLLLVVEANHPQRMRATLQFVLKFLRITHRLTDCYRLNHYLFSKAHLRGRVSVEFFHKEIELWAEEYPLFAMILLASDRRRGIMHHPVVLRVLAASTTDIEWIPMETMLSLTTVLIETHGENLKIAALRNDLPNDSLRILQLLLEPIAWGQCNERQAFRKAQKVIGLIQSMPAALRKESSVAVTNIVAIKTLEARRRIPCWKLDWLAPIVTQLEGSEVWTETLARIEQWWMAIEEEESSNGRKWKDGVGWVRK